MVIAIPVLTDSVVEVKLELVTNKKTKRVHRRVIMPDNGQILSGERCNLDQSIVLEGGATSSKYCGHCFKA